MIRHEIILDEPFRFEAGGVINHLKVVYHTSKEKYDGCCKVVVICHALTANSDPEEWWDTLVGPGKLFDTEKYFILCVNMIGSAYGTSGPASEGPDGRPYYFDFPLTTVRDMVEASIIVRKSLGIEKVHFMMGSSIGGFQAVEWAVREPEVFENVVFMATSPRVTPWIGAGMEAQRMALEADPSFRSCASTEGGKAGLRCARAQALISYRSYEGYNLTQPEEDPDTLFAGRVASYEQYQGKKLADRFDAYSYYYLTKAVDSHNVGRGRGGVSAALSRIKAAVKVVAIDSDGLFPPCECAQWASFIPGAEFLTVSSRFGHDGFLLETEQIEAIVKPLI